MALIALGPIPAGAWTVPAAALLGLWGLLSTSAPVGWWSWVAKAMRHNAEAGGSLMVAVIQLAIALGSTVGDLLFDAAAYHPGQRRRTHSRIAVGIRGGADYPPWGGSLGGATGLNHY
jgi:predicted MFS family arabinose efflux permease